MIYLGKNEKLLQRMDAFFLFFFFAQKLGTL